MTDNKRKPRSGYDPLGAFIFDTVQLPAQPGSYDTRVEMLWELPEKPQPPGADLEEFFAGQYVSETRSARLTLEPWRADDPTAALLVNRGPAALLKDAPELEGLPIVAARLRDLDFALPHEGEILLATVPTRTDTLLVAAEAARAFFWRKYRQTPEALQAFAEALGLLTWGTTSRIADRAGPIKHYFGFFAFDASDHLRVLEPLAAPCSGYYYLLQIVAAVAVLELHEAGDIDLKLPPGDCALLLTAEKEEAQAAYFPFGELGSQPVPFRGPFQGATKLEDRLRAAFRIRARLRELAEEKLRALVLRDQAQPVGADEQQAQPTPSLRVVTAQYHEQREEMLDLYLELVDYADRHKEQVLQKARQRDQLAVRVIESREAWGSRRENFVQLASNIEGLPAHFAAIPSGIADGLELSADPFGRAILRVSRQPLDVTVKGQRKREHGALVLPLYDIEEKERSAVIHQAQLLLGSGGPRWLLPQGIVAISKLYREGGGYVRDEYSYRLRLNDWIDAMRPGNVDRFKKKGRGEAFGKEQVPADLWRALLGVLNRLSYERQGEGLQDTLIGFFLILGHGEDARGPYTDIMLNPKLFERIAGEQPLFMVTNAEAMLSYDRASLDYTPAAQLGIELLARENLYNRNTATLSTLQGDGFTRYALAHRFGLIKGPNERPSHLLARLNRTLDNLADGGVIEGWRLDGREKKGADAFGVKLHITMAPEYRMAYNLTRQENALRHAEKQLERPFAPVKKPAPTLTASKTEPPPRRGRGRPRKAR